MPGRSGRGRWQRVLEARKQAREALGRDPNQPDLFDGPAKTRSTRYVPVTPPAVEPRRDESVRILSLSEAAARLDMTRAQLEKLVEASKIKALPTGGVSWMIPTSEVERLRQGHI